VACDFLPPIAQACLLPFEQFIGQQVVRFQDSILECLHHHTLSNMLFDRICETHHAWILSCSNFAVSVRLIVRSTFLAWLAFLAFQISSPSFSMMLQTRLGLPHLLIASILWCVCTHPINVTSVHLLCHASGNECMGTHDAIQNTFLAIAQDVNFHVGWKQLHVLLSTTFHSFH
jgi:hypothetical protein